MARPPAYPPGVSQVKRHATPTDLYGALVPPPEPNFEALHRAARNARHDAGLTLEEVAARSGLHRISVVNLELGKTKGNLKSWHQLAHGLGVDIGDLVRHLADDG